MKQNIQINYGLHTWDEFVARASVRITQPPVRGADDKSTEINSYRDDFTGTHSLDAAVKMASEGWPEGAAQIAGTLDMLPPSAEVLPDWSLDVCGAMCNVPAFVAGEPECMWSFSENRRDERRLALVVPTGYGAIVEGKVAMRYATAVAAMVRSLEASGINPSIYAMSHRYEAFSGRGPGAVWGVAVREFGEPLDLSKIAFTWHPSFLRRLDWAYRETRAELTAIGCNRDGYGTQAPLSAEIATLIAGQDLGNIAVLRGLNQLFADERRDIDAMSVQDFIAVMAEDVSNAIKGMQST